ncbi:MAG TPA: YceI family protein [Chryseolinea sp.]|nr:YceI family protein [Chryseolinea sp.]
MRLVLIFLIQFIILCSCQQLRAQKKYSTQKAALDFTSEAELELIKAASGQARGLIDPSTNQFAFAVEISSFKGFNSALQREHFNEKYMESEKFPKASFSGKIIEHIDFSKDGSYDVRAKGDLDIHGVKQMRIIKGKITINNGALHVVAQFTVPLSDHNISIPTIVSQKIATEIQVQFEASMMLQ